MKLFVDECLSNELTKMAIDRGHVGSASVTYRGLAGTKDWELMPIIVEEDYTLVTKNSVDFRGRANKPGEKGLYKNVELHAGLICLNGPVGMDLDLQKELFEVALDEIDALGGDLVNLCLEITLDDQGKIHVTLYELPRL